MPLFEIQTTLFRKFTVPFAIFILLSTKSSFWGSSEALPFFMFPKTLLNHLCTLCYYHTNWITIETVYQNVYFLKHLHLFINILLRIFLGAVLGCVPLFIAQIADEWFLPSHWRGWWWWRRLLQCPSGDARWCSGLWPCHRCTSGVPWMHLQWYVCKYLSIQLNPYSFSAIL